MAARPAPRTVPGSPACSATVSPPSRSSPKCSATSASAAAGLNCANPAAAMTTATPTTGPPSHRCSSGPASGPSARVAGTGSRLPPQLHGPPRAGRQVAAPGQHGGDGEVVGDDPHVVHPQDHPRPVGDVPDGGEGAAQPGAGRPLGDGADEVLARQGEQQGPPERLHGVE